MAPRSTANILRTCGAVTTLMCTSAPALAECVNEGDLLGPTGGATYFGSPLDMVRPIRPCPWSEAVAGVSTQSGAFAGELGASAGSATGQSLVLGFSAFQADQDGSSGAQHVTLAGGQSLKLAGPVAAAVGAVLRVPLLGKNPAAGFGGLISGQSTTSRLHPYAGISVLLVDTDGAVPGVSGLVGLQTTLWPHVAIVGDVSAATLGPDKMAEGSLALRYTGWPRVDLSVSHPIESDPTLDLRVGLTVGFALGKRDDSASVETVDAVADAEETPTDDPPALEVVAEQVAEQIIPADADPTAPETEATAPETEATAPETDPVPEVDEPDDWVLEEDDWISKITLRAYGDNALWLTPYLCAYNQDRGRVDDCDLVEPGQQVLVPPVRVLDCIAMTELELPCASDEALDQLAANLPDEERECTYSLAALNGWATPGILVTLAKAIGAEVDPRERAESYQDACRVALEPEDSPLEAPPESFAVVDEDGEVTLHHYWGSP